jgi:hypothetical protein
LCRAIRKPNTGHLPAAERQEREGRKMKTYILEQNGEFAGEFLQKTEATNRAIDLSKIGPQVRVIEREIIIKSDYEEIFENGSIML